MTHRLRAGLGREFRLSGLGAGDVGDDILPVGSCLRRLATMRPRRKTTMRSQRSNTWRMLWLIRISGSPLSFSVRMMFSTCAVSCTRVPPSARP